MSTDVLVPDNQFNERYLVAIFIVLALFFAFRNFQSSSHAFPIINARKFFELSDANAKERYRRTGKELLRRALEKNKTFFLTTDNGTVLVLSNKYARDVYNNAHLNVSIAVGHELHCNIPGMEAYKIDYFPAQWGPGEVRKHLGNLLDVDSIIPPLSSKTSALLKTYWTDDKEWHQLPIGGIAFDMFAQATAELRSGKELSQDPEWHRLCVDFSIGTYIAAKDLDKWPEVTHHIVHWFLPSWKKLRADIEKARAIFSPVADARRKEKSKTEKRPIYDDLVEWLEEGAKGQPFDALMAQLITGQAMLLGPADLFPHIIANICERPELVEALRAEVLAVIGMEGLTKASLPKLELMDSVIKESHRMKHLYSTGMRRYAEQSITLPDGVIIPKGSLVVVAMENMWSETIYPQPDEFQGDRFLKLRQLPGQETTARFSSPTIDHMGFGYGRHTCPGRFYADILIKVLLSHILLKYDMRSGGVAGQAGVEVRRRQEEISL